MHEACAIHIPMSLCMLPKQDLRCMMQHLPDSHLHSTSSAQMSFIHVPVCPREIRTHTIYFFPRLLSKPRIRNDKSRDVSQEFLGCTHKEFGNLTESSTRQLHHFGPSAVSTSRCMCPEMERDLAEAAANICPGLIESLRRRDTVMTSVFSANAGILADRGTGSLAFLPRKRASRHRGKVKRLVVEKS